MIDSTLSLLLSFVNNKGAYALLLGSGVSRPAGIPTGWEITQDLIRKLAKCEDEKIETSPELWYSNKYNIPPKYSDILNQTFKLPSERSNYLKQFFEPTSEEKEQGLKVPTVAHNSIAKLVKKGFIKVVITTNFDRLLEYALEGENISPNVISTIDNLEGSLPLIHSKCTIIKINGDYLDTRIRNTEEELEKYDTKFTNLLDRIFDEFGLIICGWSSDWDTGLRNSLERRNSRRFSSFWITYRNSISQIGKKLADAQSISLLSKDSADTFFSELLEKTVSFVDSEKKHPLSSKIAIETTKRYLIESKYYIRLHDMVIEETKELITRIKTLRVTVGGNFEKNEFLNRVKQYENNTEVLLNIILTTSYWGDSKHIPLIVNSIESVVNSNEIEGGLEVYLKLKKYPSLLLMYGAGVAALASNKYNILKAIFVDVIVRYEHPHLPLVNSLLLHDVMVKEVASFLPGRERNNYTPFNDYLAAFFRPYFLDIIIDEQKFINLFDKFEYLLALAFADDLFSQGKSFYAPIGAFGWRNKRYYKDEHISVTIQNEIDYLKEEHPIFKSGLFGNSLVRFQLLKNKLDKTVNELHWG